MICPLADVKPSYFLPIDRQHQGEASPNCCSEWPFELSSWSAVWKSSDIDGIGHGARRAARSGNRLAGS